MFTFPRTLALSIALAALAPATSAQSQPEIALLAGQNNQTGYLWTASFQRADGSTCVWIRIEDGAMVRVIYDLNGGFCRSAPEDGLDSFDFTGSSGDMMQFGGPYFTIRSNTGSMIGGDWNHISRDSRFDLENVTFRFLPDPSE